MGSGEHEDEAGGRDEAAADTDQVLGEAARDKEAHQVERGGRGEGADGSFPASQAATPAVGSCCGQPGDRCDPRLSVEAWKSPTWTALGFSLDEPFYYSYQFDSAVTKVEASFSAWAFGDLDCDGTQDAWEDSDGDQIDDSADNCPTVKNPSQLDWNQDGLGDACQDSDGDGVEDAPDNCPAIYNPWPQPNFDGDAQGDASSKRRPVLGIRERPPPRA